MGYDIYFGVKIEGTDKIIKFEEPGFPSPTYNIGTMLRKAMDWDFEPDKWYKVSEVFDYIEKGLDNLTSNENIYKQYEPDNGWGTVNTACVTLRSILNQIDFIKTAYDLNKENYYIRW